MKCPKCGAQNGDEEQALYCEVCYQPFQRKPGAEPAVQFGRAMEAPSLASNVNRRVFRPDVWWPKLLALGFSAFAGIFMFGIDYYLSDHFNLLEFLLYLAVIVAVWCQALYVPRVIFEDGVLTGPSSSEGPRRGFTRTTIPLDDAYFAMNNGIILIQRKDLTRRIAVDPSWFSPVTFAKIKALLNPYLSRQAAGPRL